MYSILNFTPALLACQRITPEASALSRDDAKRTSKNVRPVSNSRATIPQPIYANAGMQWRSPVGDSLLFRGQDGIFYRTARIPVLPDRT